MDSEMICKILKFPNFESAAPYLSKVQPFESGPASPVMMQPFWVILSRLKRMLALSINSCLFTNGISIGTMTSRHPYMIMLWWWFLELYKRPGFLIWACYWHPSFFGNFRKSFQNPLLFFMLVGICGNYIVHHFNSTELHCAPLTCIVHPHLRCTPCSTRAPTFFRSSRHIQYFPANSEHTQQTYWLCTFEIAWSTLVDPTPVLSNTICLPIVDKKSTQVDLAMPIVHNHSGGAQGPRHIV